MSELPPLIVPKSRRISDGPDQQQQQQQQTPHRSSVSRHNESGHELVDKNHNQQQVGKSEMKDVEEKSYVEGNSKFKGEWMLVFKADNECEKHRIGLLSRIEASGLIVTESEHDGGDRGRLIFVEVTGPEDVLELEAERTKLHMPTNSEHIWVPFIVRRKNQFERLHDWDLDDQYASSNRRTMFMSKKKTLLARKAPLGHGKNSLNDSDFDPYGSSGEEGLGSSKVSGLYNRSMFFHSGQRQMLVRSRLMASIEEGGAEINLENGILSSHHHHHHHNSQQGHENNNNNNNGPSSAGSSESDSDNEENGGRSKHNNNQHNNEEHKSREERAGLLDAFPCHSRFHQEQLLRWKNLYSMSRVNQLRDYFGEEIGYYFAFLRYYTWWLIIPAIFGLIVFAIQVSNHHVDKSPAIVVWTIFIILWFSLMLAFWARYAVRLSSEWGSLGIKHVEPERLAFVWDEIRSTPAGVKYKYYSHHKRSIRVAISWTIELACIAVMLVCYWAYIRYLVHIIEHKTHEHYKVAGEVLASVLNIVLIYIFQILFHPIAHHLTEWENHRTQSSHNSAMYHKLFVFEVINTYAYMFYIAFLRLKCVEEECVEPIQVELAIVFSMYTTVEQIIELIRPRFSRKRFLDVDSRDLDEFLRPSADGPSSDFLEIAIQFGFIVLFSPAFPLACTVAFLNNLIEFRTDSWKFFNMFRRHVIISYADMNYDNMKIWLRFFDFLLSLGIAFHVAMLMFVSNVVPNLKWFGPESKFGKDSLSETPEERWHNGYIWLVAILLYQLLSIIKFLMFYLIKGVPDDLHIELELRGQTQSMLEREDEEAKKLRRDTIARIRANSERRQSLVQRVRTKERQPSNLATPERD